jgi:hypothetical protein
MQSLRFRRYGSLFKECHKMSFNQTDMFEVFYGESVKKLVSPILRRDLIKECYPKCLSDPSTIKNEVSQQEISLFCYLVILEANDDPFTVSERFEKQLIDAVFDSTL